MLQDNPLSTLFRVTKQLVFQKRNFLIQLLRLFSSRFLLLTSPTDSFFSIKFMIIVKKGLSENPVDIRSFRRDNTKTIQDQIFDLLVEIFLESDLVAQNLFPDRNHISAFKRSITVKHLVQKNP